jgi:septal ring factor EnvC (AmiA/AmiB activator)
MAIEQTSIVPIIMACTTIFFGLTAIIWNIYNKAVTSWAADIKAVNEEIEGNTAHCINKQRDLQMQIDQVKTMVVDHKLEAITRADAHSLFEEKIKPVKESLDELKVNQKEVARENNLKFDTVLKTLSRIEGCLEAQKRRRDDE